MDIRAGKALNLVSVGVLSGIRNRVRLEAEAPDLIIEHVAMLRQTMSTL